MTEVSRGLVSVDDYFASQLSEDKADDFLTIPSETGLIRSSGTKEASGDENNLRSRFRKAISPLSLTGISRKVAGCNVCKNLNPHHPVFRFLVGHPWCVMEIRELRESAFKGCPSCQLLYDGTSFFTNGYDGKGQVIWHPLVSEDGPLQVAIYMYTFDGDFTNSSFLEFYAHLDAPSKWPVIGPGAEVSRDSSEDACFNLVKEWIAICLSSHQLCKSSQTFSLPSRVIEVGNDQRAPHLHARTGEMEDERYVALSYCWGNKTSSAQTTLSNLEDMKQEISMELLPKTILDALTITRRLGIRYLWVDSFCIIQDSPQDWEAEAARMCSIYEGAFLVIAASGSRSSQGGCFVRPSQPKGNQPSLMSPVTQDARSGNKRNVLSIKLPNYKGRASCVYVRQTDPYDSDKEYTSPVHHGLGARYDGPLSTRAWCVQESVLARRILYYTTDELTFRCKDSRNCECRPYRREVNFNQETFLELCDSAKEIDWTAIGSKGSYKNYSEKDLEYQIYQCWRAMVDDYAQRNITFKKDRLVAISGLAIRMQEAVKDEYLAGLWRRKFVHDLMWVAAGSWPTNMKHRGRPQNTRHKSYFAPSWSWASLTGPIHYPNKHSSGRKTELLEIIDIQVVKNDLLPFGAVEGGHVVVKGRMREIRLARVDDEALSAVVSWIKDNIWHNEKEDLVLDDDQIETFGHLALKKNFRLEDIALYTEALVKKTLRCGLVDLDVYSKGHFAEIDEDESYFLLAVAKGNHYSKLEGENFLVLRRTEAAQPVYSRIGYIREEYNSWDYSNVSSWSEECITIV